MIYAANTPIPVLPAQSLCVVATEEGTTIKAVLDGQELTIATIEEKGAYVIPVPGVTKITADKPVSVTQGNFSSASSSALGGGKKGAVTYKGSVATLADLPTEGNKVGDLYNVTATDKNYAWTGTEWDEFGSGLTVDQTYSAISTNPQSGVAVAQAISGIPFPTVDESYSSESKNAQSGEAVAQAVGEVASALSTHASQIDIHITSEEHNSLRGLIQAFPDLKPSTPETPTIVPPEAISWDVVSAFISTNAVPGVPIAPSKIYASRILWSRQEDGSWILNEPKFDEEFYGAERKLWDNATLRHECCTDATKETDIVDDYTGKEWPFFWHLCNFVYDNYGTKHISAIKGMSVDGVAFDETKETGVFGPKFYFFCKWEMYKDPESGLYNTVDGVGVFINRADGKYYTKSNDPEKDGIEVALDRATCRFMTVGDDPVEMGTPKFVLWGITTRSWNELDATRREELEKHGIFEEDLHLWPGCEIWDEEKQQMVERPYWCHSAFCGGYESQDVGVKLVSKMNAPLYNGLSHDLVQKLFGNKPGFGGSGSVQGFGMLFDILKNATRNSQALHYGMTNRLNYTKAYCGTNDTGYVFPVAARSTATTTIRAYGNFQVGQTVLLWQSAAYWEGSYYTTNNTRQQGRIVAIENRTITDPDSYEEKEVLCLVIDPATVQPFYVRSGSDNATAIANTKLLTDADEYACCFATPGMARAGETFHETKGLPGKHDGSVYSNSNGHHPYRVMGTEYMAGALSVAADVVAIKGNGSTQVVIDGEVMTPNSSWYVFLHAKQNAARRSSGSIADFMNSGYVPMGLSPVKADWIVNEMLSSTGFPYPVAAGGQGSGNATGACDYMYQGASPAEVLMGGSIFPAYFNGYGSGAYGGSAGVSLFGSLSGADWVIGARA